MDDKWRRREGVDPCLTEKFEVLNRITGQVPIPRHSSHHPLHPVAGGKRLATLQARAALWGGTLQTVEADDGTTLYIVTRWALTRAFCSLDEVNDWLDQVGAAA